MSLFFVSFRHSRKLSGKMSANFHTMSMSLFSPFNHFLIRRRSTPSYIKERGNNFPTLWVWYWEDINGWKKYAETNVSRRVLMGWWLLRLTVKILTNLRLTVNIFSLSPSDIFFMVNFLYHQRLNFVNFYAQRLNFWPFYG